MTPGIAYNLVTHKSQEKEIIKRDMSMISSCLNPDLMPDAFLLEESAFDAYRSSHFLRETAA